MVDKRIEKLLAYAKGDSDATQEQNNDIYFQFSDGDETATDRKKYKNCTIIHLMDYSGGKEIEINKTG